MNTIPDHPLPDPIESRLDEIISLQRQILDAVSGPEASAPFGVTETKDLSRLGVSQEKETCSPGDDV